MVQEETGDFVVNEKDKIINLTAAGMETVSYTHLDVYKRQLLPLENQGGDLFFGEPDLDIYDWMRTDVYGKGIVNVLNCLSF